MAIAAGVWVIASIVSLSSLPEPIPPGPWSGSATLLTDPVEGRYGRWALADTDVGVLLLDLGDGDVGRGDWVDIIGELRGQPGRRGSHSYRARLQVGQLDVVAPSGSVAGRAGESLRDAVMTRLAPFDPGRALLAGFLIGDISAVDPADVEAMRFSGLSHFVAVSGSNVALFLGLLAGVAGPLALGPRRRAVVGLLGLPVYAAATRFEPSVMRASVMAALALGGRLVGVVFEAWQLLSLAIVVLLVLDPGLTASPGFQLSVAATAGVLVGARWPVGNKVGRALAVTAGAQIAVAPLILLHFGSVPLFSPLVNLLAAPLVAGSTVVGALGVAGIRPLVDIAGWMASLVLELARGAAPWPQLSAWQVAGVVSGGLVVLRWPTARVWVALAAAGVTVVAILGAGGDLPPAGGVVLDVGQGDAILLHGGQDRFALVDGGPDPTPLIGHLRDFGVRSIDLVVMTHVHADHATGLDGILGRIPIGRIWEAARPHRTETSDRFLRQARALGIPVETPVVGEVFELGWLTITVEGPVRQYASPNDQSIVLTVTGPTRSMLLSGDIEVVGQADLDHLRADILKVPHQGAATSDPEWLASVDADLAVISVGPNQFGHPVDWVIETLATSGARVVRTDEAGNVVVDLS